MNGERGARPHAGDAPSTAAEISEDSKTYTFDQPCATPVSPKEECTFEQPFLPSLANGGHGAPQSQHTSSQSQVLAAHTERRKSRAFVERAKWLIRGPRPRAVLTIRHYKWWPLRPIEDAWLAITAPVAWKEPQAFHSRANATQPSDVERPFQLSTIGGRSRPESGSEGREKDSDHREDGAHEDDEHDAWWRGVKRDFRLNWLHWLVLSCTLIGWVLGFAFLSKSLWFQGSVVSVTDGTRSDTTFYGCTSTFWTANSGCGLDGRDCAPFTTAEPFDFRCPAECQSTTLGGVRAVGDELPKWVPLVVGGGSRANVSASAEDGSAYIYRGDSFICSAAIHAGVFPSGRGGCGRLWLSGTFSDYVGQSRFGIDSTPFNSTFPVSFYFDDSVTDENCQDRRTNGYAMDVVFLAFVGFVLRPKSIVLFYILVCVGFWHINFISEPRRYPMSVGSVMGDFLPTLFVAYAIWRLNFRFTLPPFRRLPLEANVWIQGFFWIGVMMNVVFANVPLNRLVASDIAQQPGALTSLIVIIVVAVILAINQVRVIRKSGHLPKYLCLAIIGAILIGLLAAVPTTGFRLHHYIIALIVLPFCAFETRLSLIYSALLLGVFLNGVGRWGFDGIIQDVAVIRGSGIVGTNLPGFLPSSNWTGVSPFAVDSNATTTAMPTIDDANVNDLVNAMTGKVFWEPIPANETDVWNSFQLLVDDVLRLEASESSYDLAQLIHNFIAVNATSSSNATAAVASLDVSNVASNYSTFPGGSSPANIVQTIVNQPHYLRLAYYNSITGDLGDFTNAATVWFNGTFVEPLPGAT